MCQCLHNRTTHCSTYCPLGSCPEVRHPAVGRAEFLDSGMKRPGLGEPGSWLDFHTLQGWVLVEGIGESCCHCALPGESILGI